MNKSGIPGILIALFKNGDIQAIESYLKENPSTLEQKHLLGRAVRHGNLEVVKKLYEMGVRNVQDAIGYIVYGRKDKIARFLVSKGADIMKGDGYGPVPIGACEVLNSYMLKFCFELSGDQLDQETGRKCLAMVLSTYSRNPEEKHQCLHILANYGADLGGTLIMDFHRGDLAAIRKKLSSNKQPLNRLYSETEIYPSSLGIKQGDGLHLTPVNGSSLLHLAMEYAETEVLKLLLELGADPNIKASTDNDGFGAHTPLFHAVVSYTPFDSSRAKILLENGADPNIRVSLRKQLRYMGSKDLERMHEFISVRPLEYGQQFHVRHWVSQPTMEILRKRENT